MDKQGILASADRRRSRVGLGRCPLIVPQQTAQELGAANAADLRRRRAGKLIGRPARGLRGRAIAERLMGSEFVVKASERLNDVVKMSEAEAGEVIQALALEGTDPRLGKGVRT